MTTEEMAVYIGERLFATITTKVQGSTNDFVLLRFRGYNITKRHDEYINWLLSPNGIHEAKLAMIGRGWQFNLSWRLQDPRYRMEFSNKIADYYIGFGVTEAEAVIAAAHKALKAEEDKANDTPNIPNTTD